MPCCLRLLVVCAVSLAAGAASPAAAQAPVVTRAADGRIDVRAIRTNLTRFNLFFPEKRDFFLEGLGMFAFAGRASAGLAAGSGDTPYLFFSRRIGIDGTRIVPLRAGGRLTGKVAGMTVGLLNVQTGNEKVTHQGEANFTVLRAKRDVLRRSSIGGMFTQRTATPGRVGSNQGFGVDATFSFKGPRTSSMCAASCR